MSLYFRQLRAGADFGRHNPICGQMANFIYLIGDRDTGECVVIDPAWAPQDLIAVAEADGMRITGALATHYHPDHVGGSMMGFTVPGFVELMSALPCHLHCHRTEADYIRRVTGLSASDLAMHDSGDKLRVGSIELEWLHTPGHTPGSSCFRLKDALIAGDTLFLQGCGRVDLPGGDPEEMYTTLTSRLSSLPGDMVLYPGHAYSGASASLEWVRRNNPYVQVDRKQWRRMMGG